MLILGEKPGKSKISKAKDLNIQVISEADLINKIYH
jgi:BRCT domain type II-containing protein